MESRNIRASEAGEHLLGLFKALIQMPKFKEFVDTNFVIKQYYDSSTGKILKVEIKDKFNESSSSYDKESLH
tara:strand:+ start:132 stop:347 length:216 start_codon:yes stop_codon:yes gene_type:complete